MKCLHFVFNSKLVSFGELTELEVRDFFFGSVESLEADQLNPGGFVVANKYLLSFVISKEFMP